MENKTINLGMVSDVAKALQELNEKMVFVGGAVISVYTDDPAADEIRPTADIDMTIKLATYSDWVNLEKRLLELKFAPNPEGHALCSFLYNKIEIDIMPSEPGALGDSNRWYEPGFESLQEIKIHGQTIRVLSAPYFIATKLEAFHSRGNDYRTSHDFEDVIYIIDNRTTIVNEVADADAAVKKYLKDEFTKILSNKNFPEIISAHIHPLMLEERMSIVIDKLKNMCNY